jgi:hypothetical protein
MNTTQMLLNQSLVASLKADYRGPSSQAPPKEAMMLQPLEGWSPYDHHDTMQGQIRQVPQFCFF